MTPIYHIFDITKYTLYGIVLRTKIYYRNNFKLFLFKPVSDILLHIKYLPGKNK